MDGATQQTAPIDDIVKPDQLLALRKDSRFRTNPAYELISLERLGDGERALLSLNGDVAETYGVLRSVDKSKLPTVVVAPDSALLLLTLKEPGPVPAYLIGGKADDVEVSLTRLVLDRLLEVEIDGQFFSGAEAYQMLGRGESFATEAPLARASFAALQHAEALKTRNVAAIAARLYCYNREPVSPRWKQKLGSEREIEDFLGVAQRGSCERLLSHYWDASPTIPDECGWYFWHSRFFGDNDHARYKIYFSPATEALPETLPAFMDIVSRTRATSFKIGSGLSGLLRPDKVIAYFTTYDDLMEAAVQFRADAPTCRVQGVPFTGAVTDDGLVSWGLDPPVSPHSSSVEAMSWRLWVTFQLAVSLSIASTASTNARRSVEYALERLSLEGIDTKNWCPSDKMWPN